MSRCSVVRISRFNDDLLGLTSDELFSLRQIETPIDLSQWVSQCRLQLIVSVCYTRISLMEDRRK